MAKGLILAAAEARAGRTLETRTITKVAVGVYRRKEGFTFLLPHKCTGLPVFECTVS